MISKPVPCQAGTSEFSLANNFRIASCRYGRVKWLLRKGKAKVVSYSPFSIQLLYETREYTQQLILTIDTGSKTIGAIVRRANGAIAFAGELNTRSREVTNKIVRVKKNRR